MFNYNHLFYFYITAKLGGVTTAAKHLNTSQSSLSLQLKNLEATLNRKLFQKVGRRLQLTSEGRVIFNYCQRAFHVTEELSDFLKQKTESGRTRISFGVSDEIERPYVTDLIASAFERLTAEDRPNIKMISISSLALAQKMNVHELDLFLTNHPQYDEGQTVVCTESMPVVLVSRPRNDLNSAKVRGLSAAALLRHLPVDLVLPSGELRFRHEVDEFISKNRVEKRIVFESNIMASISRAIVDGMGVGFLPLAYVAEPIKKGRLIVLTKRILWRHRFFLVANPSFAEHPFTLGLAEELRQTIDVTKRFAH